MYVGEVGHPHCRSCPAGFRNTAHDNNPNPWRLWDLHHHSIHLLLWLQSLIFHFHISSETNLGANFILRQRKKRKGKTVAKRVSPVKKLSPPLFRNPDFLFYFPEVNNSFKILKINWSASSYLLRLSIKSCWLSRWDLQLIIREVGGTLDVEG